LQKSPSRRRDGLNLIFQALQQRLFDLGGELATRPESSRATGPAVEETHVRWLEEVIDTMNGELEPMNSFVLPGGGPVTAFLHQARTVCRRAERRVLRLQKEEAVGPQVIPFLNRLSDALFVFSRWVAATLGENEILWEPGQKDPRDWRWSDPV